jgi:hypothetical protein
MPVKELNLEELKKEEPINVIKTVLGWGLSLINENKMLREELDRLKDNKFNWYEKENLIPTPEDTPEEKKIKILTWRLWQAKKSHKEYKQKIEAELESLNKDLKKVDERYRKAARFEYDDKSFEGLLDFSHNIRQYLISGLKHMKSCSACLDKTCPYDISRKKDENGEFIKKIESLGSESYIWTGYEEKPKEESRREWGTILGKMIKALELKEKYFCDEYNMPNQDKKIIKEGMELLIKYQDEFIY